MWVFTSNAFVSIVAHRDDPAVLVVRGRFAGDAAFFLDLPPEAEEVTPAADYRFRCYAHREHVMERVAAAVDAIAYSNFKDSMPKSRPWYKEAAMAIWSVLHRAQQQRTPKPPSCQGSLWQQPRWLPDYVPGRSVPLRSAGSLLALDAADCNHLAYGEPPF